jgi:peptidoglycan/LPS O-acetylase OafA/YrhL
MRSTPLPSSDLPSDNRGTFEFGYSPALDGIRGIAILAVMAYNGRLPYARGGFIGVDIFLALSGFLITTLLIREYGRSAKLEIKNFYYRRALRLLPALFALMVVCIAYAALFQPRDKAVLTFQGVLYTLFYVANWVQIGQEASGIGALSHAWSLSVEEQFYLIWPLLLILLLKSRMNRLGIAAVLSLLIAISIGWSTLLWQNGHNYLRMYFGSDTRACELFIGCLAALILHWGLVPRTKSIRNALGLTSILALAGTVYAVVALEVHSAFLYRGGFALIAIGTAALIADVVLFRSTISRVLEFRPLVWLGKISYGLYLWHFPIFEGSRQALENRLNPFAYQGLRFGAVLIVASASFYLLEKPFLRLKGRYRGTNALRLAASAELAPSS